jgi:protein SCO1
VRRRDLLAGIAAALPLAAARADDQWHDVDVTGTSPALELTMQATPDGRTVTQADYRGLVTMLYFGYTFCPDVCPTTLNAVADAMDKLGAKADQVQPLFITVDPKRDTPSVMQQYAAAFSPRITGLTGTPDEIAKVAKEYRVYYAEHRTGPGPNDYSMDHSSILYLMGPDGRFIAPIRADESGDQMAASLVKLMS